MHRPARYNYSLGYKAAIKTWRGMFLKHRQAQRINVYENMSFLYFCSDKMSKQNNGGGANN